RLPVPKYRTSRGSVRRFNTLVTRFTAELLGAGDRPAPTAFERELIRQAAAVMLRAEQLKAKLVYGETVDPEELIARGRAKGAGRLPGSQHVGRHVEVVCDAFGDYATFSDFNLGYPGKSDAWRLAPELKLARTSVHPIPQKESNIRPANCCSTGEHIQHEIEMLMQRPPRKAANERIVEAVVGGGLSENFGEIGLGPT